MVWLIIYGAIAVLGAVVTWLAGRRLINSWRGFTDELSLSFATLGAAAKFLEDLGKPSEVYRRQREQGNWRPHRSDEGTS